MGPVKQARQNAKRTMPNTSHSSAGCPAKTTRYPAAQLALGASLSRLVCRSQDGDHQLQQQLRLVAGQEVGCLGHFVQIHTAAAAVGARRLLRTLRRLLGGRPEQRELQGREDGARGGLCTWRLAQAQKSC